MLLTVVIAAGATFGLGSPGALAGAGQTPTGQQTHPHVKPHTGGRHSKFKLSFTLAQAPGRTSTEETSYRPKISRPAHARISCTPPQPAPIASGSQGEVETIALHPPRRGWCKGRYDVIVYLQRTRTCEPPTATRPADACPASSGESESAYSSEENTGETHFKVR